MSKIFVASFHIQYDKDKMVADTSGIRKDSILYSWKRKVCELIAEEIFNDKCRIRISGPINVLIDEDTMEIEYTFYENSKESGEYWISRKVLKYPTNTGSEDLSDVLKTLVSDKDESDSTSNLRSIKGIEQYQAKDIIIGIVIKSSTSNESKLVEHRFPIGGLINEGYTPKTKARSEPFLTAFELSKRSSVTGLLDDIYKFYQVLGFEIELKLLRYE